jgi:hypothetical protein
MAKDVFHIGLVRQSAIAPLYLSPRTKGQYAGYDDSNGLGNLSARKLNDAGAV